MKNILFEDFFDDIEIEHDEIEDISLESNCYFKFKFKLFSIYGPEDKKLDIYSIYTKLKTSVDLLSFTKDIDIETFGFISYSAKEETNQKEKIKIIPSPNKRYCYDFFGKFIPSTIYNIEITFKFNFNKISYNRFVREMNKFFLSAKQIGVDTFELGNIETDKVISEVVLLRNISNEMMRDYFNCFCPDDEVNDNSKDIIYNNYFPKFETLLNKFIDESDFDIVLKQIERKEYTYRETDIPDCLFIHLYYNIPRGKKYQRQDAIVDIKNKLFDYIPRILAVNFNICFLITSSKPFETDYTVWGGESKLKNLDKGVVEHVHNMASGARNDISTFYTFVPSDGSKSIFYMAFLNKKGKLLDGKIEFYRNMRWAYLFQPMQR